MDFASSFGAGIVETIADQSVTFPLLLVKELASLVSDIKGDRKAAAIKNAEEQNLTPIQVFRVKQEIDDYEVSIGEIVDRVHTLAGSERVLRISLEKAGATLDQQNAIISSMDIIEVGSLALRVSRILKPKVNPVKKDAADRPLAEPAPPSVTTG